MKLQEIDRSIFEKLRKVLVEAGLLPDITLYATPEEYNAAKDILRETLPDKQLIEIVSIGSSYDRGDKTSAKIIIDRKRESDGSIGAFGVTEYEAYTESGEDKFRKVKYPYSTKDVYYEIRFICQSTVKERILFGLFNKSLGNMLLHQGLNEFAQNTEDCFLLKRDTLVNTSAVDNVIEWMYGYTAKDVWVEDKSVLLEGIVPLNTFEFDLKPLTETEFNTQFP